MRRIKCKFLVVGTQDIETWTDGKPFAIGLDTREDFDRNGLIYEEYFDMKVSEVRTADELGVLVIRIR